MIADIVLSLFQTRVSLTYLANVDRIFLFFKSMSFSKNYKVLNEEFQTN